MESVPTFSNRYKGAIVLYANQTSQLYEFSNSQFSIIMLRNANLSSNAMKTVPLKLTINSNRSLKPYTNNDVSLTENEVQYIAELITKMNRPEDGFKEIIFKIKKANQLNSESSIYIYSAWKIQPNHYHR